MAKRVSKRKARAEKLELDLVNNNVVAINQGPKKKSWSVLDIKNIKPLTEAQRAMLESYWQGNEVVAVGSAGTGKTFLAIYMALNTVFSKDYQQDKMIIVRSIETTGKDIGALPGELHEKIAPFEAPYRDIINFLMGKGSAYEDLKDAGKIEFMPTTFIRGLTWDNSVVILDELQNNALVDIASVCTRLGTNSRFIACGDGKQDDMANYKHTSSGFNDALKIFELMKSVDVIYFQKQDVVRSGFTKEFIMAREDLGL